MNKQGELGLVLPKKGQLPDHNHRGCVVTPGSVQSLQEVVIERVEDIISHPVVKMGSHHLLQSGVKPLSVLVEYHRVGVAVQLLETQARVVLALDLLQKVEQNDELNDEHISMPFCLHAAWLLPGWPP